MNMDSGNGAHRWQTEASDGNPFDMWLRRALEQRYRKVLAEPVPGEWLTMIEERNTPDDETRPSYAASMKSRSDRAVTSKTWPIRKFSSRGNSG